LKRCERKDEKDLHAKARRRRKARIRLGDIEDVVSIAIDCGFHLHKDLGPGVLESVYEALLAERLRRRGLLVERQRPLPILFDGIALPEGFRVDLLIDGQLIIEVKSVERLSPLHSKQLLTYLRLAKQPVGLLMNFGGETFKEGLRRIANGVADRDHS
jgi:GxxExxY protein